MITRLTILIQSLMLGAGLILAQIQAPPPKPKPTQRADALKGIQTYWIHDQPGTPGEVLLQLAAQIGKDIPGLTPAPSRESADLVLDLLSTENPTDWMHPAPGYSFRGLVWRGEELVWVWTGQSGVMVGKQRIGRDFGQFVAGKWRKANKDKK